MRLNLNALKFVVGGCGKNKYVMDYVRIIDKQINEKWYRFYEATDGRKLFRIWDEINWDEDGQIDKDLLLYREDIKTDKKTCGVADFEIKDNMLICNYYGMVRLDLESVFPDTEKVRKFEDVIPDEDLNRKPEQFLYFSGDMIKSLEKFMDMGKYGINFTIFKGKSELPIFYKHNKDNRLAALMPMRG